MTLEKYNQLKKELEDNLILSVANLTKEYCKINQSNQIGDIVKDSGNAIIIDKITFTAGNWINSKVPENIYHGFVLTAKGEKRKDGFRTYIYQQNIKP